MGKHIGSLISIAAQWLTRLAVLNLLWLVFSLPVLTIIPSTYAMFHVVKVWNNEDVDISIFRTFWNAFQSNFFRSFKIGLPLLLIYLLIFFDFLFLNHQEGPYFTTLKYGLAVFTLFFQIMVIYSIPVYQNTDYSWYRSLIAAFMFGFRNLIKTIAVLVGLVLLACLFFIWTGLGILLIGSTATQLIYSAFFKGLEQVKE